MGETYVVSTTHLQVPEGITPWLHGVLAYMAQHCDDATLAGTAEHFGCHPNTISTAIRHNLYTTFADLLFEMRMQRAASLLASGVPMRGTATSCGYSDMSSFCKAFRRRWHATPGQYCRAKAPVVGAASFSGQRIP